MTNAGLPSANASPIRSKLKAETSTPLPNAVTAATSWRGGVVSIPMSAPTSSPELASTP